MTAEALIAFRSTMASMGFREDSPGAFSRVSFFRSTTTATDAHQPGILVPSEQSHVTLGLDVWRGYFREVIARRNARRSNLRSLRNMTHWRRRTQAWKYLR